MNTLTQLKLLNRIISFAFFFLTFANVSFAGDGYIHEMVMPVENCRLGSGTVDFSGTCYWSNSGIDAGYALFYGPSKMGTSKAYMSTGFDKSYVPYAGLYKMRTHVCAAESSDTCSLAKTTQFFDTVKSVQFASSRRIIDHSPYFGGGSGTMNSSSSICFTFVAPDGSEWATSAGRTCQDAPHLPEVPSFCYLNMGQDLSVDMGTIERGMISTVPGSTTKKNVPLKVMCSGDASLTATFTFQYTPITIIGSELVSSSINGVGVGIYFNDKFVSSNDSIDMDFSPGVTEVNLGFEVVRDPYVNIGDIGTGEFFADVVLVLTKH